MEENNEGIGNERNEGETSSNQEDRSALTKVKCGKAARLNGIAAELLSKGGETDGMAKKSLFVCFNVVRVPEGCRIYPYTEVYGSVIIEKAMTNL